MRNSPLVTIGVSTYNRKDLLRLSLNSLLEQSYKNCEIVVVDDGSSDGTEQMVREEFPQVKYIYQENAGDAAAKNHAARAGSGEYIVFNDSDDLFLPDAVERLVEALPEDGNGCSYGTYQTIDAEGNFLPTRKKVKTYPSGNITVKLLEHIVVNCGGTLMPRQAFLDKGGFNTSLPVAHDYDFFLRFSMEHEFYAVQNPVFLRRRHGSNLSAASYRKIATAASVFDSFISDFPELNLIYGKIISCRKADFHHKLYREALREKLFKEVLFHAKESCRLSPTFKNRMLLFKAHIKYLFCGKDQ